MRPNRPLKRRAAIKPPKRKFVLFCEGANTEPDYFEAIKSLLLGALIDLDTIEGAGVPLTIAKKARAYVVENRKRGRDRSSFEEDDEIWAVFDRDAHPHINEALQICKAAQVKVAFSDPCFEIWLMLHERDFDRPDDRHQLQTALTKVLPDYDPKTRKTTDCSKLMAKVVAAEKRGEKQLVNRRREGEPPSRPFTTVFELTRSMRHAHEQYVSRAKS